MSPFTSCPIKPFLAVGDIVIQISQVARPSEHQHYGLPLAGPRAWAKAEAGVKDTVTFQLISLKTHSRQLAAGISSFIPRSTLTNQFYL